MSVQTIQLNENFSQIAQAQINKFVEEGKVIKNNDGTYCVTPENSSMFTSYITTNKIPQALERTTNQNGVVISSKESVNITFTALVDAMNLPEDLQQELKDFLVNEKIQIADNDEIAIDANQTQALNNALKKFAEDHKENFVNKDGDKFVKFDQSSDKGEIDKLKSGEPPVISEIDDTNTDKSRYKVESIRALEEALPEKVGGTEYIETQAKKQLIEGSSSKTTVRRENIVDTPADLRNNKAEKKQFTRKVQEAYREHYVNNNDPKYQSRINTYLATTKYQKDIEKEKQKIEKEWLSNPENNNIKNKKHMTGVDIIEMFADQNLTQEQRTEFYNNIDKLINDPKSQEKILQAYKDMGGYVGDRAFADLTDIEKRNAAIALIGEQIGSPEELLTIMAADRVLSKRSDAQIEKDNEYFVKHQTKDYVKNQQAQQDFANTEMHYSKADAKKAEEDGKIHNDIGKYGRRLVDACDENLFFTNGKFDSDKYKAIMRIACDPSNISAEDEELMRSMNMRLEEGREGLMLMMPTRTGSLASIEQIIGNGNDKVGNRELNRWRHMVKDTNLTVDKNTTNAKRLLNILEQAGIGFGLGALTGGLGALLTGPAKLAAETAAQTYSWSTQGRNVSITVSGRTIEGITPETIQQFTTDPNTVMHTVELNVNGRTIEYDVSTFVPGQTYDIVVEGQKYTVEIPDETYNTWVDGEQGEITVNGQKVQSKKYMIKDQTLNSAYGGALLGAMNAIISSGKIHAKGRNNDNVYALTREVTDTEDERVNLQLDIPQYNTVETRQSSKSDAVGYKQCKLKVRHAGPNLNKGETMEDMVAQYYGVEQGSEDYKIIFDYVKQFNELKKFGGYQYPLYNIVNLPDYIPEDVIKRRIDRKANPEDPNQRIKLAEQDIPLGKGRFNPPAAGHKSGSTVFIKARYGNGV